MDQTWIDISSPSKEEIDSLILAQNINPIIAKDLLTPTPKQYIRQFENTIYAVMHIPFFIHSDSRQIEQEIDFIITNNKLITTRYDSIDAVHHFSKQIEVAEILNKSNDSHLFFGLMREIYKFLLDEIEYIQDQIREVEKNIFRGQEKEMVWKISKIARGLLTLKRTVGAHKDVWLNIEEIGGELFGKNFKEDARQLREELQRLMILVSNIGDMVDELRETNNSILSTKQNEVMKIFTILAFITFPLSLMAGIFGMNTAFMPIVGYQYDFWVVIAMMLMMSLAMFIYFKYKDWI